MQLRQELRLLVNYRGCCCSRRLSSSEKRVHWFRRGYETGNGASGMSDIEGKATRVGASEHGQRMSFNLRQGDTFNAPDL